MRVNPYFVGINALAKGTAEPMMTCLVLFRNYKLNLYSKLETNFLFMTKFFFLLNYLMSSKYRNLKSGEPLTQFYFFTEMSFSDGVLNNNIVA